MSDKNHYSNFDNKQIGSCNTPSPKFRTLQSEITENKGDLDHNVNNITPMNCKNLTPITCKNHSSSGLDNDIEEFNNINAKVFDDNKLRMQIMEKDKIIFEYSKILKDTERVLDNTKKLNSAKEEIIIKYKDEQKDLKFKIRNLENILGKKEEEFEKYRQYTEEKIMFSSKEKNNLEEKLNELTHNFENNQGDFQTSLVEYKKLEKQLIKLKASFQEKEDVVKNYEKMIEELKKEIKHIPSLKKQINDYEYIIKDLKSDFVQETKKNEKINQEREELDQKIQRLILESKDEKETSNNLIKLSYELENFKKEVYEKTKEIEHMNEKYKNLNKENDNFVQIINIEIANFSNFLENITININYSKNLKYQNKNSNQFSLKYELIQKNFEILKNKIIENYNSQHSINTKLEKSNFELEKQLNNSQIEKDKMIKDLTYNIQKLNEITDKYEEMASKYERLNETHSNLKETHAKLKTDFNDLNKKNENICQETQLFMNNCVNKLKEKFPDLNDIDNTEPTNLNFAEKIIYF